MPEAKQVETEINELKEKIAELAIADATSSEAKKKELQEMISKKRQPIADKLIAGIRAIGQAGDFNVILDKSANSLNGVPVLMKHDLPDLTDELIALVSTSTR